MANRSAVPVSIDLIQRCIDSIESRLDSEISLERLAKDAGISFWHFLRVFRATVGETPKDYIRRRRLTRAACALVESQRTVLDIALEAGFESNEAFTRAFRLQFNRAPRDFRAAGELPAFPRAKSEIGAEYLQHLQQGITRNPEIVRHPYLRFVGLRAEFALSPDAFDVLALGRPVWDAFLTQLPAVTQRADENVYLLCEVSVLEADRLRASLMPCVAVSDFSAVPDGWHSSVRASSRDAVFQHRGAGRAWEYTLHYVFDTWRSESGEQLTDQAVLYRFRPETSPFSANPELELWLALSDIAAA